MQIKKGNTTTDSLTLKLRKKRLLELEDIRNTNAAIEAAEICANYQWKLPQWCSPIFRKLRRKDEVDLIESLRKKRGDPFYIWWYVYLATRHDNKTVSQALHDVADRFHITYSTARDSRYYKVKNLMKQGKIDLPAPPQELIEKYWRNN